MSDPRRITVEATGGPKLTFDFDARTVTDPWHPTAAGFMKSMMDTLSEPPLHLVGPQVDELVGLTGSWDGPVLGAAAAVAEAGFEVVGWSFPDDEA